MVAQTDLTEEDKPSRRQRERLTTVFRWEPLSFKIKFPSAEFPKISLQSEVELHACSGP